MSGRYGSASSFPGPNFISSELRLNGMKSIYFTGQDLTNILPHDAVVFGTAGILLATKK